MWILNTTRYLNSLQFEELQINSFTNVWGWKTHWFYKWSNKLTVKLYKMHNRSLFSPHCRSIPFYSSAFSHSPHNVTIGFCWPSFCQLPCYPGSNRTRLNLIELYKFNQTHSNVLLFKFFSIAQSFLREFDCVWEFDCVQLLISFKPNGKVGFN